METTGYKIFLELQRKEFADSAYINVESVPYSQFHKIGIAVDGFPVFFVKCNSLEKSIDINLEFISVLFSQDCQIKESEKVSTDIYTIVVLKTLNRDLQQYFTDVFSIILQQLPEVPTERELYKEVRKVIDLFSSINNPPRKSLQGLWCELLIIEKSNDVDRMINSWHVSPNDKYDFNDGKDKLEVKSTSREFRIHKFSLEQLNPNPNSQLLIASVFALESGIGKSVLELRDLILLKTSNIASKLKLNETLYKTIGSDYVKIADVFFDYQFAVDRLAYYNYSDIPSIDVNHIPLEISSVSFDCDLSGVPCVHDKNYDFSSSKLLKSIGL